MITSHINETNISIGCRDKNDDKEYISHFIPFGRQLSDDDDDDDDDDNDDDKKNISYYFLLKVVAEIKYEFGLYY
jgi:hypothetical protein